MSLCIKDIKVTSAVDARVTHVPMEVVVLHVLTSSPSEQCPDHQTVFGASLPQKELPLC